MGTPGQMDSGAKYTFGWLNDKEAGGTDAKPLWCYFEKNGAMAHGWVEYKGERYYMGEPGYPDTGLMYNGGFLGLRHTFNVSYGETDTGITALMYPAYKGSFSSLIFTTYDKNEMGKVI